MNTGCKCKDCTKRKVGCHSTCTDYKEWKINRDQKNKETRLSKLARSYRSDRIYSRYSSRSKVNDERIVYREDVISNRKNKNQ